MTYKWLFVLVFLLMLGFTFGSTFLINCFTDLEEVAVLAETYKYYVLIYPLIAGIGLALYGMFTGATYTVPIKKYDADCFSCILACGETVSTFTWQ